MGECTATVQIHDRVIDATFVVVDVSTLYNYTHYLKGTGCISWG